MCGGLFIRSSVGRNDAPVRNGSRRKGRAMDERIGAGPAMVRGGRARRGRWRKVLVIGLSIPMLVAGPVHADAPQPEDEDGQQIVQAAPTRARAFDIPAGGLEAALLEVTRLLGLQVLYPAQLTAGLETAGVQGTLTPEAALEQLLAGTGLTYRFSGPGTITLARAGAADESGAMRLAPIEVTGALVGTRVGETVLETSASVELFTAQDLEELPDTRGIRDLYDKTPNIVDFGESNLAPAIRGVDSTGAASGGLGFIAGTRPRATLTVDGRPLSTAEFIGGPTGLWDVEQVEVYRGPQTTLQGRNSIAGAFVVETKDPTFFWEGATRGAVGTENRNRQSAMLSGPVVDGDLAFRVAVDRFDGESFVDYTGPQAVDDIEDDENLTVRGKLLLAPEALPAFSTQLTLEYQDTRRPQQALVDPPFDERAREVVQTAFETESFDVVWDIRQALTESVTLSNSATYADIEFRRLDAPENGQVELEGPQITNETLLNYDDPDAGLEGVLGAYVFYEDREDILFTGTPLLSEFQDDTLTTSVFGEVTWEAVPRLHLTVGGRYEREARQRVGSAFGIDTDLDETFDAFLPKFGVAYDIADTATIGASVSRGFNAGGGSVSFGAFNAAGERSPDPAFGPRSFTFDSEFVWNYELYARALLLDERLTVRGNVFFSDYRDQQRVEQIDASGGFTETIIVNTPDSRAYGAEIGASYLPVENLELFADVGLLETEIVDARDPELEGNEFARAPNVTANVGAVYRPAPAWTIAADASYVGSYFSTDVNNPLAEVDSYVLANARLSWQAIDNLHVFGSITNIFDSDAETRLFGFPATAPPTLAQLVEPRVFWIGAELRF